MSSETDAVLRKGQIGTTFTGTVDEPDPNNPGQFLVVDLSTAILVQLEFKRPDKTTFLVEGAVSNTPTDGTVTVNDDTGLLDQVGDSWEIRAIGTFSDGSVYPGSWAVFTVGT